MQAFKVASADLTNLPLLAKLAATGKPLIVSTGMSTSDEIRAPSANFLDDARRRVRAAALPEHLSGRASQHPSALHGDAARDPSARRLFRPRARHRRVASARSRWARCVIERHITLDRTMEGPDHAASLEPDEFKALVAGIREVEAALGEGWPNARSARAS